MKKILILLITTAIFTQSSSAQISKTVFKKDKIPFYFAGTIGYFFAHNAKAAATLTTEEANVIKAKGNMKVEDFQKQYCTASQIKANASTAKICNLLPAATLAIPQITADGPITFSQGGSVNLRTSSPNNQWYKDGVAISNAISSTITVLQSGKYNLKSKDVAYNNTVFSNAIVVTVTALQPTTQVVNSIDNANGIAYKTYLQMPANATNRKGIVLLAEGNNENDPSTGDLNGAFLNNLAAKLAAEGYVAAIVAYADEPALKSDWSNWNSNCEMLTADVMKVSTALTSKHGIALSKVITGGVSYGTYALLSANGTSNMLTGTRGILATCGATGAWQAGNFKVPIYSLACTNGSGKGWESDSQNLEGNELINAIGNTSIKNQSSYYIDANCNTHCGGNTDSWIGLLVAKVKSWLP